MGPDLWQVVAQWLHRLEDTSPAPLDTQLLSQVDGSGGTEEGFRYGGFLTALGILSVTLEYRAVQELERILDFGCGSGRVALWLRDLHRGCRIYGVDINRPAVEWCKENVEGVDFDVCEALPPLALEDGTIDLAYGISVLTHLDEDYQFQWLDELRRVVRPGGLVLLSVHGSEVAKHEFAPGSNEEKEFQERGFSFQRATDRESVEGLPDFYQAAYHAKEYIERNWRKGLRPLAYVRNGPFFRQDLVVMERDDSASEEHAFRDVALPMSFFDSPRVGSRHSDSLPVSGWAFSPLGPAGVELDLYVDGTLRNRQRVDRDREDVFEYFGRNPYAVRCGFQLELELDGLSEGPHALWACRSGSPIPCAAVYFLVGPPI